MTPPAKTLRQILVKIHENKLGGRPSLAVFDLDSTLFNVGPRLEKILMDFAELPESQKKFPDQVAVFKNIKVEKKDWGIKDALMRAGLGEHHSEFHENLRDFWKSTFFSNEYLKYDVPYPGAASYVQAISDAGAEVAYLTGRDVARMGKGSAETLKHWGFPLDNKSKLILKPHRELEDAGFKTNWFLSLPDGLYGNIWFFENEPVNIHHMLLNAAHLNPPVEMVYFDSTHSRRAEPPDHLPWIMHFLLDDEDET